MRVGALETEEQAEAVRARVRAWEVPHAGCLHKFEAKHQRAVQEEWLWIRRSRVLSPQSDLVQWIRARRAGEEPRDLWWIAHDEATGDVEGVLQLRRPPEGPKIHGLVARRPGCGAGSLLVRHALERHPRAWVGAHPSAQGFYANLGFRPIPGARTKLSEIPYAQ